MACWQMCTSIVSVRCSVTLRIVPEELVKYLLEGGYVIFTSVGLGDFAVDYVGLV